MGIGGDISEVFKDVGTKVTVTKHADGAVVSEYIDTELAMDSSSPFAVQFTRSCTLSFNTKINAGDIVVFDDGSQYLLIAKNQDRFENDIVVWEGILYVCNVHVTIKKRKIGRDADLKMKTQWDVVTESEPVLLTGQVAGKDTVSRDYGEFMSGVGMTLHISANVQINTGDTCFVDETGERFKIGGIEPRRLANILMVGLDVDTRE